MFVKILNLFFVGRGWRGPAAPEAEIENLPCRFIIKKKKSHTKMKIYIHITTITSIVEYGIKLNKRIGGIHNKKIKEYSDGLG